MRGLVGGRDADSGLVGREADRGAYEKAGRDEGGEARKREETPGHDSCIGSFGHAHYPSNG
jgi:hypothetical protein